MMGTPTDAGAAKATIVSGAIIKVITALMVVVITALCIGAAAAAVTSVGILLAGRSGPRC